MPRQLDSMNVAAYDQDVEVTEDEWAEVLEQLKLKDPDRVEAARERIHEVLVDFKNARTSTIKAKPVRQDRSELKRLGKAGRKMALGLLLEQPDGLLTGPIGIRHVFVEVRPSEVVEGAVDVDEERMDGDLDIDALGICKELLATGRVDTKGGVEAPIQDPNASIKALPEILLRFGVLAPAGA